MFDFIIDSVGEIVDNIGSIFDYVMIIFPLDNQKIFQKSRGKFEKFCFYFVIKIIKELFIMNNFCGQKDASDIIIPILTTAASIVIKKLLK